MIAFTDHDLDLLRREGDPAPDRIIEELARDGDTAAVNLVLRTLVRNHQAIPEELPDNIEFWLRDTSTLPEWVDRDKLDRAAQVFVEHGVLITLILSTGSLVHCYAAQTGSKALAFTYRLGQNAYRRIAETAQFVLLVMAPGGFDDGGQAIPAVQKVRLMHSAIRYLIRRTGRWPEEEYGVPICQEDMLGTLMTFSYFIVDGLRELGATLTDEDAEAYCYHWRVVGELMGIRPEIIPTTMEEAVAVSEAIARRHQGPSEEGVAMTRALLEYHADAIPGRMFDGIIPALIRRLVGNQVADWMEVPRSRWEGMIRYVPHLGRAYDFLDRTADEAEDSLDRLAVALLTRQSIALNGYERAGFEIPTQLRVAWSLPSGAD